MSIIFLFLFGLTVGSFLNVVIDRLSNDQSIVYPPSFCDHCKKSIPWYGLIPAFSFILLKGRCVHCHKSISWQYPFVEVVTGVMFVFTYFVILACPGSDSGCVSLTRMTDIIYYLFIISCFIVVFFTDFKYGIILDKIIFPAIAVTFLYHILYTPYNIPNHLLAGLGAFLFFLALYLGTKGRGIGFGDVKLVFLLGLFFGFPKIVLLLYIAFLTGAAFSIILIIRGRKKLKETIVFGPFLILAAFLVFFFSDKLNFIWEIIGVLP